MIVILIATGIAAITAIYSSLRRILRGATSLIVLALALFVWGLADSFSSVSNGQNGPIWLMAIYFTATLAPTALLTFTLEYTKRHKWLDWRGLILLGLEPLVIQVLLWIEIQKGQFEAGNWMESYKIGASAVAWNWINPIYSDCIVLIAVFVMVRAIGQTERASRTTFAILLAGIFLPIVARIIFLMDLLSIPNHELTLLAFAASGALLTWGSIYASSRESVPITRDALIENMSDGWMVLDPQNRIVDLNPAVEKLLGFKRANMIGKPAEDILRDWSNLIRGLGNVAELDMQGSVNVKGGWRYLNTHLSLLKDKQGNRLGQLITWRDNTHHKAVEDARQKARDEMFILLNSISGAASRAQNTEDFLSASLYQIVYSFNCQAGAIYLQDESTNKSASRRFLLSAHHGFSEDAVKKMYSLSSDMKFIAAVLKGDEPLVIPDMGSDPHIPEFMRPAEKQGCLLIVPMTIDGKPVGLILVLRKENVTFKTDEITRLSVLAREMVTFVHSERQRHLAISLAERQRVMRDLHDSVTQKLYGLVTLIEAAQAGLEAGTVISIQVLSRIGENARQALREMRLFLHQLNPVDLEREGLIGALHQRLAAVEGRSDIKARLIADGNIFLSLDAQVALYYIAQEALNNILKHAHAKSVNIRLRKRRASFVLEVEDDGNGFNPKKENPGCMGLRNMRERVLQVGGKLKVDSRPGEGTRIIATILKEKTTKVIKKHEKDTRVVS